MRVPIPYEALLQHLGETENVLASIKYLEEIGRVILTDNEDGDYDPEIFKIGVEDGLKQKDYEGDENLTRLQKKILDYLVGESQTFFVLQNTQSGKGKICADEIKKWSEHKEYKVVPFFFTSNDKTLADHSAEEFLQIGCDLFVLSSNNKSIDMKSMKNKILTYEADPFKMEKMPMIAALANKKQNTRVLEMIDYICQLAGTGKKIRYGLIFDEADSTYPAVREQVEYFLDNKTKQRRETSLKSLIASKTCLHRAGWVTATEGDLVDNEEYEECAEAELYEVEEDDLSTSPYRAIHTQGAKHEAFEQPRGMTNNQYALSVIRENKDHFFSRKDGIYRKVIINSNPKVGDMMSLARECVTMGMNALVFNMDGLSALKTDGSVTKTSTKNKKFNKVLFDVVEDEKLDDRPLVIIGRRKVDRGLSFHYAPRDGGRGLVWTDIILGRIVCISSAVQKAGRMAGRIARCPQYTGECYYWAPQETLDKCVRKNQINDKANLYAGTSSLKEAIESSVSMVDDEHERIYTPAPFTEAQRLACEKWLRGANGTNYATTFLKNCDLEDSFDHTHRDVINCGTSNPVEFIRGFSRVRGSNRDHAYAPLMYNNPGTSRYRFYQESKEMIIRWRGSYADGLERVCCYVKQRGKYKGETCGKKCASDSNMCSKHSDEASYKKVIVEDDE